MLQGKPRGRWNVTRQGDKNERRSPSLQLLLVDVLENIDREAEVKPSELETVFFL